MNSKIAVIGQSVEPLSKDTMKKAKEIGKLIAKNYCILYTGASTGYPYESVKGAAENNCEIVGVSPAVNEEQHKDEYDFPTEGFTRMDYTGNGIPRRNYDLIEKVDAAIVVGGKIGTLNEFTLAYHKRKVIGVLLGSAGITNLLQEVATVCNIRDEKENIIYSQSPEELVKKVLEKVKNG